MTKSQNINLNTASVIANYCSLAIVATSGLVANFIIVAKFGTSALGIYNLSFAIYLILSQVSTFGIQLSCLRIIPITKIEEAPNIIISGLCAVLVTSLLVCGIFILLFPLLTSVYDYSELKPALNYIAIATALFSINKVLLFSINGLNRMTAFAIAQALRGLLMIGFIILISYRLQTGVPLVATFVFSELVLGVLLLVYLVKNFIGFKLETTKIKSYFFKHLNFGKKAFLSGLGTELNARVDVIVLGIFVSEAMVGLYSFISMVVEGVAQLLVVLKNNLNPLLSKAMKRDEGVTLEQLSRKMFGLSVSFMLLVVLSLNALYYVVFVWFDYNLFDSVKDVAIGQTILFILTFCLLISSGWLIFDQLLALADYPDINSAIYIGSTMLNLVLNFILIPSFGLTGAAFATGVSWVVFAVVLNWQINKKIGINVIPYSKSLKH